METQATNGAEGAEWWNAVEGGERHVEGVPIHRGCEASLQGPLKRELEEGGEWQQGREYSMLGDVKACSQETSGGLVVRTCSRSRGQRCCRPEWALGTL